MEFKYPSRVSLAHLPTPIEEMNYHGKDFKINLYVKRDDLTECGASGNKVRKLEFLFAEAKEKGADTIITCGGVQSNHARVTALFCARLGYKAILVLRGEKPKEYDGNLFLDMLLGSDIRYITRNEWPCRDSIMERIGKELAKTSHTPYIIPEGASNPLGSAGYIFAIEEIKNQLLEKNIRIDYIVCSTGSGGTQAGLLMGSKLFMPEAKIIGFSVCDNEKYFKAKIRELIAGAEKKFNHDFFIKDEDITIVDGYMGRGYAVSRIEELELIHDVARRTGIILDPVYTGKAFYGLLEEIRKGRFGKNSSILFLHTGGIYGLFPKKSEFIFDRQAL